MKWFIKVLKNYTNFNGRASRSEFWFFTLFNFIFSLLAILIDNILNTTIQLNYVIALPYGYIFLTYSFLVLIPGLAVAVRRLHDISKSGWMYCICLIPIIGSIWLLILFCSDSVLERNKWGEYPK